MRVLFLNTNIDYAGATKIMLWLAGCLAERGEDVTFLTFRDSKENREVPSRVNHVHLPLEIKGHSIPELIVSVFRLHKYIKDNHFDLGIAFLSPSQIRLSLSAIGTPMRVLLSQRGDPYQTECPQSLMTRLSNLVFCSADMYVFQTKQAKQYYSKSVQSRAAVIPNPVQALNRTSERNPDNRIVSVARLDINQKRQDLLIEAFKLISYDYPEVTLHFYGDGEDEERLKRIAEGNDRIYFEGVTNNIVKDIQNARVFVLSSDYEGIPNSLIEAMSLGVPSVSTKCSPGGAELLISHGVNGLLAPCGDAQALSEAIRRFLDDEVFAERCGYEARAIVDTFSEDRVFHSWESFIFAE